MSKSEWISILKLATLWIFKGLRAGAVSRLTGMMTDPIEEVLLGRQYSVPQWLRSGYGTLVNRSVILSLEEARLLNFQTAFLVCQAREREGPLAGPTTSIPQRPLNEFSKKSCRRLLSRVLNTRRPMKKLLPSEHENLKRSRNLIVVLAFLLLVCSSIQTWSLKAEEILNHAFQAFLFM